MKERPREISSKEDAAFVFADMNGLTATWVGQCLYVRKHGQDHLGELGELAVVWRRMDDRLFVSEFGRVREISIDELFDL